MQNPITVITDKVMRMIKGMVYLTLRTGYRRGATAGDITSHLKQSSPAQHQLYHEGIVERALFDLQHDGKITQSGARWYLVGAPG